MIIMTAKANTKIVFQSETFSFLIGGLIGVLLPGVSLLQFTFPTEIWLNTVLSEVFEYIEELVNKVKLNSLSEKVSFLHVRKSFEVLNSFNTIRTENSNLADC